MPMRLAPKPCPRCLRMAQQDKIRVETVMPLPRCPPLARDGSGPCCHDCASADSLLSPAITGSKDGSSYLDFEMARIAVGNDRQEDFRLPCGMRMGLVLAGLVRHIGLEGLGEHHKWQESVPEIRAIIERNQLEGSNVKIKTVNRLLKRRGKLLVPAGSWRLRSESSSSLMLTCRAWALSRTTRFQRALDAPGRLGMPVKEPDWRA
jgi:hypothetical protein